MNDNGSYKYYSGDLFCDCCGTTYYSHLEDTNKPKSENPMKENNEYGILLIKGYHGEEGDFLGKFTNYRERDDDEWDDENECYKTLDDIEAVCRVVNLTAKDGTKFCISMVI